MTTPSPEALALAREIAVALKPTNKGPLGLARREAIIRARLTPTFAEVDATAKMLRVIETALLQRTKERDAAIAALRGVADRTLEDGSFCFCADAPHEQHVEGCRYCDEVRAVLADAAAREKGGANGE